MRFGFSVKVAICKYQVYGTYTKIGTLYSETHPTFDKRENLFLHSPVRMHQRYEAHRKDTSFPTNKPKELFSLSFHSHQIEKRGGV